VNGDMSYDPSHRKPPRQERWPNATPGEGWPAYTDGNGEPSWTSADARAGSTNGYATASHGYGDAWGGRTATAEYGYGGAPWDGPGATSYQAPEPTSGYWADANGYGGATTTYPAVREGYADGFDGAADGYGNGATDGYADGYGAADGYGQGQDYYQAGNDWDGYAQPGREFGGSASSPEQDEYPALDPAASSVLVAPDTLGEWWRQDGAEAPAPRGPIVGAVMGILAAAVAIGVATFAAAFVRPQASPVSAVGGAFIARIPATLKTHLMAHFGAHGQTMLLLGTAGLIAIVLGFMARRNVSVGVAGIAAFGLLAGFIAVTRPESRASDVIPSAIGGLAGIVALLWLARASAPVAALRPVSLRPAYSGSARNGSPRGGSARSGGRRRTR
jgi:hypothetical protein